MCPDLSSGSVVQLNLTNQTGLIQDDFDENLKLTFNFGDFNYHPNDIEHLPSLGDEVNYYILYHAKPTAKNIYYANSFAFQNAITHIDKPKFWQRPTFWFKLFCLLLGVFIGAWRYDWIHF